MRAASSLTIPRRGRSQLSVSLVPKVLLSRPPALRRRSARCTTRIPVRFPSTTDPGDAGWHFDGSYDVGGQWWANVRSRDRALLALFLFTNVGEHDAPTEILVGSHLDVPRLLVPFGERGVFHGDVELQPSTLRRRSVRATGRAGDVYVCHPFLVHRATWPHLGTRPRMLAQPAIGHYQPFELRDEMPVCAVERAILQGLGQRTSSAMISSS